MKLLDVRVCRNLAWGLSNFPTLILSVKFVPGQYNEEADVLSRWIRVEGSKEEEKEGLLKKLAVNVSTNLDKYT